MLTPQERQVLVSRIEEQNKALRELRTALNQLNDQKQALVAERVQVGRKMVDLIRQAKKLRHERDELTRSVRTKKVERDKLNTEIHSKIEEIKKASAEQKEIKAGKEHESPHKIERQIEQLQYKVETEIVEFQSEQKLMKQIKELKRRLEEAKKVNVAYATAAGVGKEIDALRKKADGFHKEIQDCAKSSQEKHESLLELSKKIDALRPDEEAAEKKIAEKQKEMDEISAKISEKLSIIADLDAKITGEKKAEAAKKNEAVKKKLGDRQAEVREKLKGGKSLSTDDLLILQSMGKADDAVSALMNSFKNAEHKEEETAEEMPSQEPATED